MKKPTRLIVGEGEIRSFRGMDGVVAEIDVDTPETFLKTHCINVCGFEGRKVRIVLEIL